MRPHAFAPALHSVHAAIVYKNFAAHKGISHIGLGVTAATNSKVLKRAGVWTEVLPVTNNIDVVRAIRAARDAGQPFSHVIISAPWLSTFDLSSMVSAFPEIHFVVASHSNVGFLQADPNGVKLLRQAAALSLGFHNFSVAGNCLRFVRWFETAYKSPAIYLPNLYALDELDRPAARWQGGVLRIGCFGAVRPLKNMMTAAAAALEIATRRQADLELWISGGRSEGGGDLVRRAVGEMFSGLTHARLVDAPWRPWPEFRAIVRTMHLLLQVSYTESFNMVTADGAAEGVPSVVSDAIDWAPRSWRAPVDDASRIAAAALNLLRHPRIAVWLGRRALRAHNREGVEAWKHFFLLH